MIRFLILGAVARAAYGSSSADTGCRSNEAEVDYLRGARDGDVVCKPNPARCSATASCADNNCIRDVYGLCDAPYLRVACSNTFPPTIISCNP